jgi:hypothetical protein
VSFVDDILLKLSETPTVQSSILLLTEVHTLADAIQVFHDNRRVFVFLT